MEFLVIVSGLAPFGLWREAMKVISVSEETQPEGPTMRPLKGPINQGEALPLIPHKSIFLFLSFAAVLMDSLI